MNALIKHLEETQKAFKEYAKYYTPNDLPDVKERWDRLKSSGETIDADAFIKPFILGWARVIEKNWYTCEEQRKRIADDVKQFHNSLHCVIECELKPLLKEQHVFYALYYLEFYANFLGPSEHPYHISISQWMKICFDVSDEKIRHFFIFYQLNRDVEMRRILFNPDGVIREFFRSNAHGLIYLPKLADWLLNRYDLDVANIALRTLIALQDKTSRLDKLCASIEYPLVKLCTLIGKTKQHFPKLARRALGTAFVRRLWLPAVYVIVLFAFLFCTTVSGVRREVLPFLANWIAIHLPFGDATQSSKEVQVYWVVLPYQIGVIFSIFLGLWWFLHCMKGRFYYTFRLLLPRLLGGILLGYIPLFSSEEFWKWLLSLKNQYIQIILFLSPLVLSFIYAYIEARNFLIEWEPTKRFRREIYIRATKIFLIGLSEAFIAGILLSELLSDAIVSNLGLKTIPEPIVGFIGLIYPKIVLLYAPAALFIGLLVQLIWEEKSITQPL